MFTHAWVWKPPIVDSSNHCTSRQIRAKQQEQQQQQLQQSELSCSKQDKMKGRDRRGYWLMHPAKGATYGAYCDWAAWHYWGGSGISPADCGPGSADSRPGIWPPRLLDLRYWGAVSRSQPQDPAPWGADFLYGYLQGGCWLCLGRPVGPGWGARCWEGTHLRWWRWRCSRWI